MKIYKYKDNVDTDVIIPARYLNSFDAKELASHAMVDIDRDYPVCGEELWNRFRMKDKATIGWYYKGVREALREAFAETEAFAEYCSLIDKNFG